MPSDRRGTGAAGSKGLHAGKRALRLALGGLLFLYKLCLMRVFQAAKE